MSVTKKNVFVCVYLLEKDSWKKWEGENDIKKELEIKKILNAFTQTRSAKKRKAKKQSSKTNSSVGS